ncbi:transposase [Ruoffia tabacinasalis]|uniref:transposase n=1 Tax=Ruoffia tabacinasalis TaxID=87458 RepID=UPI003F956419
MYEPYMDLIHRWFLKAKIIIDPFHIIQALNRELNRYRVQFMNSVHNTDQSLYNKLKYYWKLILKNPAKLQATTYDRFRLFDWLTNTQNIVNYLLEYDACLRDTYRIVHRLSQAYRLKNWELFESTLIQANQHKISSGLKRVLRSFKKYLPYIRNSFTYTGLTNGPLEGTNNKIKVLKRNAYGYRNYSHFRNRILLMTRLYEPKPKKKDQATLLVA